MNTALKKMLLIGAFLVISGVSFGQQPPPPGGHGSDENEKPAPLGSGLGILLALGLTYGGKKVFDARKKTEKKET